VNTIVKVKYGSHLYGTNTPTSDLDIKGIYMPSKNDILLSRVNKCITKNKKISSSAKNTIGDIDEEYYSLHYFINLACEGQTVALEMLHAPENMIYDSSPIWNKLVDNKHKFYTKSLKAFIGYARNQAAKYGIKGDRLLETKVVIDLINKQPDKNIKISSIWDLLPLGKYRYFLGKNKNGTREYQICGKIIQETVTLQYALDILKNYCQKYGARAKQAELNEGLDWHAISHAIRASYQIKEILSTGTITFPLKQASFIKDIKQGKLHYTKEVLPILEKLMSEVEQLSNDSTLPNKVDRNFWDNFLIDAISNYYFKGIKLWKKK